MDTGFGPHRETSANAPFGRPGATGQRFLSERCSAGRASTASASEPRVCTSDTMRRGEVPNAGTVVLSSPVRADS
jgi:hypothetical protein